MSQPLINPKRLILVIALICESAACSSEKPKEVAVKPRTDPIGMMLYEARKSETISSDIALRLADMVFRRVAGDEVVANQLPFTVIDQGESWLVQGTRSRASSIDLLDPVGGQLIIVIKKTNCEILELSRVLTSG